MTKAILIACGGAAGALLRYAIGGFTQRLLGTSFPYGTLLVNLTGCFIAGVLYALLVERAVGAHVRLALLTGCLGAYTTFSAFSLETVLALEARSPGVALANVLISVPGCLAACWAGLLLARSLAAP